MKKWMIGIAALAVLALVLPGAAVAQGPVECAQTYVVQPGDTLAKIADQFYDDPWAYPVLVFATNLAASDGEGFQNIADPNLIEVGWRLCIPEDETAMGTVDVNTLKNSSYLSEWTAEGTAALVNGVYSESAAPGSAIKTVIRLHDRMAFGYTAGRQQFAAVVLVTDPGGSGTFYELAVLTVEEGEPQHVASASLGDRVRLLSLSIEEGEVVVEMIAQGPDDPMCCPTQYTVERYALQGEELVEVAEDEVSDLVGVVWEWERFVGGDDSVIEVEDPSLYTLTLNADGTFAAQIDCNRGRGSYTAESGVSGDLEMRLGPITRAACGPDSRDQEFIQALADAVGFRLSESGDELRLLLPAGDGELVFRAAAQVTLQVSLEGTSWKLVSYRGQGSALVSVLDETEVTAAFAEGRLTGSAGCNNYSASYQLEGEALTVGPAAATRKMCLAPTGIMEQEQAYLAALESVAGYRIQETRLELLDAGGAAVATLDVVQEPTE